MKNQTSDLGSQTSASPRPRVLALSSTGGHWIQMLRLRPAFEGCDITFCTTNADYKSDVEGFRFRKIIDANRTQKFKLVLSLLSIAWVVLTERPDVILSTGAAPGFFAIRIGKLLGIRTIWIDSIANAEELSLSGQKVGKHAGLWLTQWEHLAKPEGPLYYGNVLGEASEEAIANPKSLIADQESSTKSSNQDQRSAISDKGLKPSDQRLEISDQKSFRIFVTVGSDVPFDRMVKVIDKWSGEHPETKVFAQIGRTSWKPENIKYCQFLTPIDFTQKLKEADLIIAHAGMGSILSAFKEQKPILVMPRLGYLGETRNEHQTATAKKLQEKCRLNVAFDEEELCSKLDSLDSQPSSSTLDLAISERLIGKISTMIPA